MTPAERFVFLAPPHDPVGWLAAFAAELALTDDVVARVRRRSERRLRMRWEELDVLAHARRMTAPLLVVHDRRDATVPYAQGAAIARAWPGADLVTTDGLDHRGVLRDPAVVARVLAFVGADGAATAGAGFAAQIEHELFDRDARWDRVRCEG